MDIDPLRLQSQARAAAPDCRFWSLRAVTETSQSLRVRQDIAEAPEFSHDRGLMITVVDGGGIGHAATSDLTGAGMRRAFERAQSLARIMAGRGVFDFGSIRMPSPQGRYQGPAEKPLPASLAERFDYLQIACKSLKIDPRIVDWSAQAWFIETEQVYLTGDGGTTVQHFRYAIPNLTAVARVGSQTQTRTAAGQYNGFCRQGGLEVLDAAGMQTDGPRVAEESLQLAMAPNCPSGDMDVVLMPDQMMLQIHESIGHPLELDRILGDERNFAGTSFVTLDMFGSYRYGSSLLNVSHDPGRPEEIASFAFDDEGLPASKQMLIEEGVLKRPLGGSISAARARALHPAAARGLEGVATARASSWNRAPIDRMSNLNIEPGASSLAEMIASIDDGVLMRTNCSWSIDDSRNKFQFGCEYGRLIRNGKLGDVVRNPNYRGVSATFWRSLSMTGDASTWEVLGTPFCGKGEPMQVVRVGHASPACKFSKVAVFGGGE
ncbi:MAG: TldD/PmbA family protein [Lautropia sp.]|nr:TldD/PmbA family protein [Lautropia sp.]